MPLISGTRLGSYEVVDALGAGGMGEVYRARDTRLDRDVAIKILPEALARDPERLARLEREAKVLASLNHRAIASIYALDTIGDLCFLVMELAPGSTLAELLKRSESGSSAAQSARVIDRAGRPIPVDDALPIARQMAEALEAAHEKGIIHRDLKPANVKVAPNGQVKLLDFGLAKALASDDTPQAGNLSFSPTIAPAGMTVAGVILGTAAYMSPEQARGKTVDARSDIWAFGCVVYEMLTGRRAFPGETVTDILAAVLRVEPDWSALPAELPAAIRSMLRRCLQKDPDRRLHHIADARIEIEEAAAAPLDAPVSVRPRVRYSGWLAAAPWALAMIAAIIAPALWWAWHRDAVTASSPIQRFEFSVPAGVQLGSGWSNVIAIAPDAERVAYVGLQNGVRQVFVRRLDRFETEVLQKSDGAMGCFFAPDGKSLGVIANTGGIKSISLVDGTTTTLAEGADVLGGATWLADNTIVFARHGELWQTGSGGQAPTRLSTLDRGEFAHRSPVAVPDSSAIVFTSQIESPDGSIFNLEAVERRTAKRKTLRPGRPGEPVGQSPQAVAGRVVFAGANELVGVRLDSARLELIGQPVPLAGGATPTRANRNGLFAVSQNGTLVFAPDTATTNRLMWVSRQGHEQPASDTARFYSEPRLSPDGRRLAVSVGATGIWIQDLERDSFTRITPANEGLTLFPIWTPDGKRIVFANGPELRSIDADGGSRSEIIAGRAGGSTSGIPTSITPDGSTLAVTRVADTSGDIVAVALDGRSALRVLLKTVAYEGGARFSPDGRWLAYMSDESGQPEIYIRAFPSLANKLPVSTKGGTHPVWSRDGKELFYREGNKMMVVNVAMERGDVRLSSPHVLFEKNLPYGNSISAANFDISPDGQRFILIAEEPGSRHLNVVINWINELNARVPK